VLLEEDKNVNTTNAKEVALWENCAAEKI